jgi:hypothetical protein
MPENDILTVKTPKGSDNGELRRGGANSAMGRRSKRACGSNRPAGIESIEHQWTLTQRSRINNGVVKAE